MARQWHYAREGQRFGPITDEQLQSLAQSGEIQPDDLVWTKGMAKWMPARSVKGLTFAAAIPQSAAPAPADGSPLGFLDGLQDTSSSAAGPADFLPSATSLPRYSAGTRLGKRRKREVSTGGILNIIFGVVFILGGLSGVLVLRGTRSGGALAVVGVGLVVLGLYRLAK